MNINDLPQGSYQPIQNPVPLNKPLNLNDLPAGSYTEVPKENPIISGAKAVGNFLTSGTQKFGKTIGESVVAPENAQKYADFMNIQNQVTQNLQKAIKAKQQTGGDTTSLQQALDAHLKEIPSLQDFTGSVINKTPGQVIGEGGLTALEALSGGILSSGAETATSKGLSLGQKVAQGAKIGAGYGAIAGGAGAMAQGQGVGGTVTGALTGAATGAALGAGTEGAIGVISKGAGAINEGISKIIPSTETSNRDIIGEQFRKTAEQYTRPSKLLSEMENKSKTDPIGVLQTYGNKIIPTLEKGKITANSIEEPVATLESGIEQLSNIKNDTVFLSDENIPLSTLKQRALDQAEAQRVNGWSVAKVADAQNQINKIFSKLEDSYNKNPSTSNGLSLSEIDRIKTEQTGLSKAYKNLSAKPFELDAHAVIGKAARDLVEQGTGDASVKELNKVIQSHYDAIDLLNSLVGKTPHGGKLTKALETVGGEIVGGALGSTVGHTFLGAVGGRMSASIVDDLLHSKFISNPLKRMLVEDIGIQEPAIKSKVLDYINQNMPDISELGNQDLLPKMELKPKAQQTNSINKTANTISIPKTISSTEKKASKVILKKK